MQVGGKGIICAHSGTVLGLIVSADGDIENMKQSINEYMGKDFSYLDSVEIINQGIIDRKCDANEFDKE
jgi:L-threonine kinase